MPINQAEAQAVTLAFVRDYPGALELAYRFRDNTGELYGHRAAEVPADLKGGYVPKETIHNGRAYRGRVDVPLANMDDAADLVLTLRHEVLGHYGANTFKPAEKRALLDGLIAAREEPSLKPRWEDINRRYAGASMDVRAEEVWALHCESIAPSQHVGQAQVLERGQQSFMETCIARVRPMQVADLHNIVCMVADGLHDRSRTQQTFPQINELFRRDETMEPKKPFHEVVAEKLIEQLKAGTAPWQRPWEPGEPNAYLPMNPTTGKRYKGINAIHLMAQGRSDGRWMTYKQAAAVGAQVRKGEKGTPVQYWKFSEEQNKVDESGRPVLNAKGEPVKETVQLERPRVFFATVFNAEQIDGLPPIQKKEQTWSAVERAEHILKASGASITHAPGDRAFYRPATDSIHLPDRGQFPSADNYYATALHELGHWTGHASRLDRDLAHPFGSEGYAKEELRAEIASMILGDELGIGHDPGQHAAYVGSWIKALQDEPLEVFRAAADAEKIHDYVLAFEQKQVQEQEQAQVQQPEQHYSDLTLQALVEKHGWEVAYSGLQEPGRVDSVHRTFEGVGPLGTMTTPNGERRLSAGYHDDAERRRYVTLKLGDQVIGDADGRDQKPEEIARQINAKAEQYADERRVKNGLEPIYSIATQQAEAQQLNDELREHGQQIVSHLDAQSRWGDGERIFAFHEQDGEPHQVKSLAELESYAPDQLLALPALTQQQETTQEAAVKSQADKRAEAAYMERVVDAVTRGSDTEADKYELAEIRNAIIMTADARSISPESFQRGAKEGFDVDMPLDWNGRIQVQGNVIEKIDGDERGHVTAAHTLGVEPEFYGVYAQREDGTHQHLADFQSFNDAQDLADRLGLVAAINEQNEHEKAASLARLYESALRRNPNSTDEAISAAKEARKDAESAALLNDSDMQRRIAEIERQQTTQQQPAQSPSQIKRELEEQRGQAAAQSPSQIKAEVEGRKYINVPYREKNDAKALGARWDRQEQSWYVPAGVDAAPFAKWAQGAATAAAEARPAQQAPEAQDGGQKAAQQARQYLAVPYEQRNAAKAAGALWDKAAKSWYAGPRADMAKLEQWKPENVQAQQGPAMTPREEFAEAMRSAGLFTGSNAQGDHPIMDGKRHRVPVEGGKKGALDGFYVGHLDGHPAGRIINNKTGTDITWKSKGYALSDQEKAKLQAEAAEKLAQRAAEQDKLQEATAQRVGRQMADLVPVEQPTPYLQAKGIEAHAGVFTDREGQKTYIPAFDAGGKQWTMQYIQEDGTKRFAKDSKKEGCFHPVGGMDALAAAPALVISEGYATAASLAEGLGHATVAAFDSGNLPHVARALREKFPDKPIVIAGDDDKAQEIERGHNPGRAKAEEAAKDVGGKAIFPIFAPGEQQANPKGFTDFNDLANKSELGRDGLKRQVGAAVGQVLIEEGRRQQQEQRQERAEKQQQQPERPRRAARIG
jgi:Antirestriction protein